MNHKPFLETIAQHPADMGPRLVYSDWLEERGDVRGEYIRTSIELAEKNFPPEFDVCFDLTNYLKGKLELSGWNTQGVVDEQIVEKINEYIGFRLRLSELLTPARRREWLEQIGLTRCRKGICRIGFADLLENGHIQDEWRAGFPEVLTLRWEEWQRHYRTLIDAMPVREVRLTTGASVQRLSRFEWKLQRSDLVHTITDPDICYVTETLVSSLLAAEFPGHDPANPIKYTLPEATDRLPRGIDPAGAMTVGEEFIIERSTDGVNWTIIGTTNDNSMTITPTEENEHYRVTLTSPPPPTINIGGIP